MYTKKVFSIKDLLKWTRFELFIFFGIALVVVIIYDVLGQRWLTLPWTPMALVGTAVAFVIGFQNNAAYGRIWEARKIWGGIVNTSRTLGMWAQDMITNEYTDLPVSKEELYHEVKTITYRHIGWMTALRHSMRQPKSWENVMQEKSNKEWANSIYIPERLNSVENDLKDYLSKEELNSLSNKGNKQTAILYLQSNHLRKLKEQGLIWEFSFLELEGLIQELFTLQGQSERIKNFPYPRQFATLNHYFVWIFVILIPIGIVPQFYELGSKLSVDYGWAQQLFVWLSIPFCMLISWIFHTMERIGRTGENPFEGSANDVPISTMARGIEIDLRQNLNESTDEIPAQFPMLNDTQM